MKRILFITIILFAVGIAVHAQQSTAQSSAQVKQSAQQYLSQVRSNTSRFDSTLVELQANSQGNKDAQTYNRLRAEIEQIEAQINEQEARIRGNLESGTPVSASSVDRLRRMVDQYKAKSAELERFAGS
jgi:peptidoglycan hydrolase CwlO-like protein